MSNWVDALDPQELADLLPVPSQCGGYGMIYMAQRQGGGADYYVRKSIVDSLLDHAAERYHDEDGHRLPDGDPRVRIWDALKTEFRALICTEDERYSDLRNKLKEQGSDANVVIVSIIASCMATYVGTVAGILVPFCSLLLLALARMGKEVFCKFTAGAIDEIDN